MELGLGVTGQAPTVPNLNTQQKTGLFRISDANAVGLPEIFLGTLIQNNRDSVRRNQIIHNELEMFFRGEASSGFQEWKKVYHSGNTNFNEFEANGSDFIAFGIAVSQSYILFSLPLNFTDFPTSATFEGSFNIDSSSPLTTVATLTSLTLDPTSSNRLGILSKSGLTGLNAGETYWLRAVDSSSKITINC